MRRTTLTHYWGRKVSSIALELYSYDPTVGGARLEMACCSYFANGGVYTDPVGTITLPQQGQPGTVYFNGYFTGTNIAMRTFGVDVFGTGTPGASTSGGASLYGFSSTATGTDGYYRTTPLYAGQYKTYLNEKGRSARSIVYYLWNVNVGDIFDFAADVPCFGVSQPHSPADDHILTSQECSSLWAQP